MSDVTVVNILVSLKHRVSSIISILSFHSFFNQSSTGKPKRTHTIKFYGDYTVLTTTCRSLLTLGKWVVDLWRLYVWFLYDSVLRGLSSTTRTGTDKHVFILWSINGLVPFTVILLSSWKVGCHSTEIKLPTRQQEILQMFTDPDPVTGTCRPTISFKLPSTRISYFTVIRTNTLLVLCLLSKIYI